MGVFNELQEDINRSTSWGPAFIVGTEILLCKQLIGGNSYMGMGSAGQMRDEARKSI